ncbi:hypothetical protein ATZ33_03225 [Enterococcus silesiacus]|uniref:Uncharacterized protein n=1 Tax=Enterococcus silesiacus TaxID=332949 RepID=A0A0S3K825_9ENTE|nr:hypothetical protein [Enterococcus silesiacus]ALS00419.1 hypothetical protein ATZ33_03225 [Enterococcus silesiacus]OJG90215.1 hypothetical protein RV15_GL001479 [Enterococcus silesiacus]
MEGKWESKLMKSEMQNNKRGKQFLDSILNIEKALRNGSPIFVKLKIEDIVYPESTDFEKVNIVELTRAGLKVYQQKHFLKAAEESFYIPFDSDVVAKVHLVRYLVLGTGGVPSTVVYTMYEVINNSYKYIFICDSIACVSELEKFYKKNNLKLEIPIEYRKIYDNLTVEDIRNKVIEDKENFEELPMGMFLPII